MLRIDETLQRIIQAPHSYPIVYRQLRRAVIRQFPFAIFYEPTADDSRLCRIPLSTRPAEVEAEGYSVSGRNSSAQL
jgi:hypothetical protein